MKIVVLCGGLSPERSVSLSSATMITIALRELGHTVVPIDMYLGLEDYPGAAPGAYSGIFQNPPELNMAEIDEAEPDLDAVRAGRRYKSDSLFGLGVLEVCAMADLVFIAMHGICGEDGRVQAALELLGIPFTGSDYFSSAVALDKDLTKKLVRAAGILTPDWYMFDCDGSDDSIARLADKICSPGSGSAARLADKICSPRSGSADNAFLPCVVKPPDSGSSIGVAIARDRESLISALKAAARQNRKIVVEQYIEGREIQVGVLDGAALPSIEILVSDGFYDYKNKYLPGAAREICPADIPAELERQLGEDSLLIHKLLGLSAYSRSDFIIDGAGDSYFLEVNTLPGMTPTSLIPQEAAAAGIGYAALCQKIVELAIAERGRRV